MKKKNGFEISLFDTASDRELHFASYADLHNFANTTKR